MNAHRLLVALLMALTLAACGGAPAAAPLPPMAGSAELPAATAVASQGAPDFMGEPAAERDSAGGAGQAPIAEEPEIPQAQLPLDRMVIKNAQLAMEVESVGQAEAAIRGRAGQLGGYIVSVATSGSDEWMVSTIVVRIPSQRFEEALAGVEGLAHKLLSRNVSGEDVTEEFVDLESRARNLEATRARLLALLEQATRVDDALMVNQAITDVQAQLEQIKGRMQYLRQSAAMSTIAIELRPIPQPAPLVEEDAWQPIEVAREALRDLLGFGQGLLNVAIVLAIWSPVWLPIVLVGRWGFLRLTRGFRSRPAPAAPAAPASPGTPETPGT